MFSLSPNITQSPQILPPILLHPGYILLFILTITRAESPLLTIILFNFILLIHFFHFLICQQLPILLISFFPLDFFFQRPYQQSPESLEAYFRSSLPLLCEFALFLEFRTVKSTILCSLSLHFHLQILVQFLFIFQAQI